MSWVSAITRSIPYAFGEYVIFLGLVEWNATAALLMGIVFLALGGALVALKLRYLPSGLGDAATWEHMLEAWFGNVREMTMSFLLLGAALILWSTWNASGTVFFSWLSILGLLGAMIFVVRAQRLAPVETDEA